MRKLLFFAFLTISATIFAQEVKYDLRVDSVTYQYYLKGDWNQLIDSGKKALRDNIDFKFLRQRIAYAYFMKGNYFASQQQYEKALLYDDQDIYTKTYLYYCGLYTGNKTYTRYREGLLPDSLKTKLGIKPVKLISSLDCEYNYKSNNSIIHGNPSYLRGGIESQLGYRVNLYQAVSNYTQNNDSSSIKQNEYFASFNWAMSPHLALSFGYHFLNSKITSYSSHNNYLAGPHNTSLKVKVTDTLSYSLPGYMFNTKLTYTLNRFDFGLSGSIFSYDSTITKQYGAHIGVVLPGEMNVYLKSSLYGIFASKNSKKIIFSQSAGALIFKKLWAEGELTLGNLNNFSDNNGMYIYNSLDPTTFRTGLSLFWNVLPKLTLFGNYTYDQKLIEINKTNYNQHSISSGIIWKL